jgi:hypothetical protein
LLLLLRGLLSLLELVNLMSPGISLNGRRTITTSTTSESTT